MLFLLVWWTERVLALLPCTCILQHTSVSSLPDLFSTS
jgi:hypothetical protein